MLVDPIGKSLVYVFVPVVLVWLALFSLLRLLMELFVDQPGKLHKVMVSVGVSFVVLLFLLSGIGQLTFVDIVLVTILSILSIFYFYRSWA